MNRFHAKFLEGLAKLSDEYKIVITADGELEPLDDWIDNGKQFKYTCSTSGDKVKLGDVEQL